jgi:hypothetical protein
MTTTPPVPPALKAVRASLRTAAEPALRDRLSQVIAGLERLYGVRSESPDEDQGDMRRRKFARARHNVWKAST